MQRELAALDLHVGPNEDGLVVMRRAALRNHTRRRQDVTPKRQLVTSVRSGSMHDIMRRSGSMRATMLKRLHQTMRALHGYRMNMSDCRVGAPHGLMP